MAGFGTLDSRWTVDGTPIYAPTAKSVDIEHDNIVTSGSGRTESGYMHIRWVRRDITKVNMEWEKLTGNEKEYLLNLMQGKEFTFRFWDGRQKEIRGYVGKTTYTLDRTDSYASQGGLYRNVKIDVVEM